MNAEVKFGIRSKALANITQASSKTTLPFPCFLETGANSAWKLYVFRKI